MNLEQASNDEILAPAPSRRRWFQWSLRGLMLFCVVVAIGIAWYKHQAKYERQREIAEDLRSKFWTVNCLDNFSIKSISSQEELQNKYGRSKPRAFSELRPYLAELTTIQTLDLWNIEDCQHDDFKALALLPMMSNLGLLHAKISDTMLAPLANCRKLETLNLSHTEISDNALATVGQIQSLQILDLTNTKITDEGLRHLAKLKNLQRLILNKTLVTGSGLEHLQGCTSLQMLDLSNTALDNNQLSGLSQLMSLTELNMHESQFNDQGMLHLGKLRALRDLYVSDNPIHAAGVAAVKNLPSLRYIDLNGTLIYDDALLHLQSLQALTAVRLNGQITPAARDQLQLTLGNDVNILDK